MDSVPASKSDRFQTLVAVAFMCLFAAIIFIVAMGKDNITSFVCNYIGDNDRFSGLCSNLPPDSAAVSSNQPVDSKISSACVDSQGLNVSVVFSAPLTGDTIIQVFSSGPDFFPSNRGLTDSYELSTTIMTPSERFDFVVPVASMPEGELIFGNIFVSDEEGVFSHVTYLLNVYDCATANAPLPDQTPMLGTDIPVIYSATCLPNRQLMIGFEFEKPVLGQYKALVAGLPYQLVSVVSQPAILYFSGNSPPEGPIVIRLVSATNQAVLFEETYNLPTCSLKQEASRSY